MNKKIFKPSSGNGNNNDYGDDDNDNNNKVTTTVAKRCHGKTTRKCVYVYISRRFVWNVFASFGGVPGVNENQIQMCLTGERMRVCVHVHEYFVCMHTNNQQIIFLRGLSMQIEYLLDWENDRTWIEMLTEKKLTHCRTHRREGEKMLNFNSNLPETSIR